MQSSSDRLPIVVVAEQAPEQLAFRIPAAASACGMSEPTFRKFLRSGEIPARIAGTVTLILREDLAAWLRSLPSNRDTNGQSSSD